MKNIAKKSLVAVLALSSVFSTVAFTGCGALEMTDIVVDQTSIDRLYTIGDTVDFAAIKITAKFNDGSTETVALGSCRVYMDNVEITGNLNKITEAVGTKTIKIMYNGKSSTFDVTVSIDGTSGGTVVEWGLPSSYLRVKNEIAAAGTAAYGETGYETQFAKADDFVAGDDNAFKFKPMMSYLVGSDLATPSNYTTNTTIYKDGSTTALATRAGTEENTTEYYDAGTNTLYVVSDDTKNEYDFTEEAVGSDFKLAVLPTTNYELDEDDEAVVCEVSIVDGYNVYSAKELSVIDNNPYEERCNNPRTHWDSIKAELGLTGIDPNAVVLQADISMTKEDIPSNFYYTLQQKDTWYTYEDFNTGGKTNPIEGHDTYMYEGIDTSYVDIFSHKLMGPDDSFKFYGNFHTLNIENLPLVRSLGNSSYYSYGGNFSSDVTLFHIQGYEGEFYNDADRNTYGQFEMVNLNVKGNANIEDRVNAENGDSVYAGGTIFMKARNTKAIIDNVIERTSIYGFLPEFGGVQMEIKNTKVYDSYQNAIYGYNEVDVSVEKCTFERAGGPLIMAQSADVENKANQHAPHIEIDDDSILNNFVVGDEFWFSATGANAAMEQIKLLQPVFDGFTAGVNAALGTDYEGRTFVVEKDNLLKMNFIALMMPEGGPEAAEKWQYQGYLSYRDGLIDRDMGSFTFDGSDFGNKFLSVLAIKGGTIAFNTQNTFAYMDGTMAPQFQDDVANMMMGYEEVMNSNYITINMGGLSMLYGFYPNV